MTVRTDFLDGAPAGVDPVAGHVCPVWVARLLASPLRRLTIDPDALLRPYVRAGMTVADVGCAAGFFTVPMARRVGAAGRVIAVDVQAKLLEHLDRRLRKADLAARVEQRACTAHDLGLSDLTGEIDFILAMHVVHEAPAPARFLAQLRDALKPDGRLLLAEPKGHVHRLHYLQIRAAAAAVGFATVAELHLRFDHAVLLAKEPYTERTSRSPISPLTGEPLR